ncbi:MAG: M23 family metallopeptidase [Bacteroidetes bacterium]|nr:M23 family metallopeptidase [Bacteroidota bacterium]
MNFLKIIFLTAGLFFIFNINSQAQKYSYADICEKWNLLDEQIKNGSIEYDEAVDLLKSYEPDLIRYYRSKNGREFKRSEWVFPLKNFTSVYYRENGNDYRLKKYDYFQGSNSKGHPAHDIMIFDDNKDLLDDSTMKPVDVVSMSGGIVVATDTTWKVGSLLRGGKYVKVFDVTNKGLFYYSHLSEVIVKPGDIVIPGDKIGEVGRTGRKAILKEGKTHVHVSYLKSEDGYPVPEDIINDLRNSQNKITRYQ